MKTKSTRAIRSTQPTAKQIVRFEYEDPTARNICIAGSFNNWHASVSEMINMGSGKWVKDLELAPGTYEYRFIVDGKWVTDPRCVHKVPNQFGETNSLLQVPELPPQPARATRTSVVAAVLA